MKIHKEIHHKKFRNQYLKVMVNIIYTGNWLTMKESKRLKPFGITIQQHNVLGILKAHFPQPVTINMIIIRMLDKMSNVSRIVDKLQKKGLVEREENQHDRRAVDVTITQEGLSLLQEIDKQDIEVENQLNNITIKEAKILNKLLDKLRG